MLVAQKELLELVSNNSAPDRNLMLYFCGTVNQCLTLKTLLTKTNHNISVYYFDKTKCQSNDIDDAAQQEEVVRLLEHYKKQYRNFEVRKIQLSAQIVQGVSDLEDPIFHVELLKKIYPKSSGFNSYLITQDLSFFKDQLKTLKLHNQFERHNPDISLLAPFQNSKSQDVAKEALSGYLIYPDLNLSKIGNDNKQLINGLKSFNINRDKREDKLDKFITTKTNYDSIYIYMLFKESVASLNNFLKQYGYLVSKEVHIQALTNLLTVSFRQEELVTLSVLKGKISDEELNQILLKKISNHTSNKNKITKIQIDEIDCFFRFYSNKITEETKDQLLWESYKFRNFYNKPLLEKLIDWKCDVGNLLLRVLDDFADDIKESRALILLEDYQDKIHQLQLNEALLMAYKSKLYELCDKLIEAGANKEILKFHPICYANVLFYKTKSRDMQTTRRYWRTKDRVIIAEILKELGNPQNKVPPVIHVTGSSGKGSTCALLRSILEKNSYKVHMFTSPAVVRGNENYIIAGQEITDEAYYGYLKRSEAAFNKIKNNDDFKQKVAAANKQDGLSDKQSEIDAYCDWSFIIPAAMLAFCETKADVTIIEVVTGGELDVTNVFDEKTTISTIVNTIILGDTHVNMDAFKTIEGAASTKSRLFKKATPVVSAKQEGSVTKIIKEVADDRNCQLSVFGKDITVENIDEDYFTYKGFGKKWKLSKPKLVGDVQVNNAALALSALLQSRSEFKLDQNKTSQAIKEAYSIGRFTQIDCDLITGYEKIYFGTIKSKHGELTLDGFDKKECTIIKKFRNLSNVFVGGIEDNLKGYNRVILLSVPQDHREYFDSKLSQIDLDHKNYLSSCISHLDQCKKSKYLLIPAVGIDIFPGYYSSILNQFHQPNFQENLKFAIKNNLIDKNQIDFIKKL